MMTTVKLQKFLSHKEAQITLINQHDYHYQTTWLHENAAGTLHHDRTRIPIKEIINRDQVNFVQDTVVKIKPKEKKVKLKNRIVTYDILVIGLGFEAATSAIPGFEEHAFTIEDINSARLLREHLKYNFAQYYLNENKQKARLNIVINGGGFTGVAFAGELANRIPELCKEYDVEKPFVRIINIDHSPTVLANFNDQLAEYAMDSLESRGVEFITGASIKECKPESIVYEKANKDYEIPTMTYVWAAGVRANSLMENSGFQTHAGKIAVTDTLASPEYEDVFVVGDCAEVTDPKTGDSLPPSAQLAIEQSKIAAYNIKAKIRGEKEVSYQPRQMVKVASLGTNDGVGVISNNLKIFGWKASFIKKIIDNRYLFGLGGFKLLFKKGRINPFY